MRRIGWVVLLAFGTGASADAWAMSKEKLAAEKDEMKEAKKRWKAVSKLADKWGKAHEKGKEVKDIDAEIQPYLKEDIAIIRAAGVEVRDPVPDGAGSGATPPDAGGGTEGGSGAAPPPEDKPILEALRDIVVPLRDGEVKGDEKAKALNKYAKALEDRYDRETKQYEKAKAES